MEYIISGISGIIGAAAAGIPLWIMLRRLNVELKAKNNELDNQQREADLVLDTKEHDLEKQIHIDKEAEWKRIIDERNEEIKRLRERDDAQEAKLHTLFEKSVACEKNEARHEVMIKMGDAKIATLEEVVKELRITVRKLKNKGKPNGIPKDSTSIGPTSGIEVPPQPGP